MLDIQDPVSSTAANRSLRTVTVIPAALLADMPM